VFLFFCGKRVIVHDFDIHIINRRREGKIVNIFNNFITTLRYNFYHRTVKCFYFFTSSHAENF
jgi:hypothetical protein